MYCVNCGNKLNNNVCKRCSNISNNNNYFNNVVNSTSFFIVNLIYFIIGFLLSLLVLDKIFNSDIVILASILIAIIGTVYNIVSQLMLVKARLPWWGMFVPVYSVYLTNKLCFKNGMYLFILFIPFIISFINIFLALIGLNELIIILNIISYLVSLTYSLSCSWMLGKRFGMNGLLVIFFPFITMPIIAFSRKYQYID